MTAAARFTLDRLPVIDAHSHGSRLADSLAADPARLEQRLTFLGMTWAASEAYLRPTGADRRQIEELTGSTVFALTARRHLARLLGCAETAEDVARARHEALRVDPGGYVRRLFADQDLRALIVDEGYPDEPPVPRAEYEAEVGVPVYRAWRIESYILDVIARAEGAPAEGLPSFVDLEEGFLAALEDAARDDHTVAFKSVIAYLGGLDVSGRERADVANSYTYWAAAGAPLEGVEARELFTYLLRLTLHSAPYHGRPVHIHCGGGDASMADIGGSSARDLYPLLREHRSQPIVLVNAGYPWLADAAYVASVLPHVYLDLSGWQPWATTGTDGALQTLIGTVPTAKLMHGTDAYGEPEILWLGALLMKSSLQRTLQRAVDDDYLSADQAEDVAAGILGGNALRLHGLDPRLLAS